MWSHKLLLCLVLVVPTVFAGTCDPPKIKNGEVTGVGDEASWVGTFRCKAGYMLVGAAKVKCREGLWSSKAPVCSAMGVCDRRLLPRVKHARRVRFPEFRESVFNYVCKRGYMRYGEGKVYCNGEGWDLTGLPICAKSGCDESLVSSIRYGRTKSISGAIYKFHCEEGSELIGPDTVWCNGKSWNESAPQCYKEASAPGLSVYVNGNPVEPDHDVLTVRKGDEVTVRCEATEGNPDPEINMMLDHTKMVEPKKSENSYTFQASPDMFGKTVICSAENSVMSGPVTSFLHLRVMYEAEYVSVTGPTSGHSSRMISLTCQSGPSFPETQVHWDIPQDIEELDRTSEVNQSSDGSFITSSNLDIVLPENQASVKISCTASSDYLDTSIIDQIQIDVYSPTGQPSLVLETAAGQLDEKANSGDLLTVSCNANGGSPSAIVTLEMDGEHLGSGLEATSSTLLLGADHDGVSFNCSAINAVMSNPVSVQRDLKVLYGPETVEIEGPGEIANGEEMEFTCSAGAANPQPTLRWTLQSEDGAIINPAREESATRLIIWEGHDISGGIVVVCAAEHPLGDVQASHHILIHGPVLAETVTAAPIEGVTDTFAEVSEDISDESHVTVTESHVDILGNEIPTNFEEIGDADETGLNNFEIRLGEIPVDHEEHENAEIDSPYKYDIVKTDDPNMEQVLEEIDSEYIEDEDHHSLGAENGKDLSNVNDRNDEIFSGMHDDQERTEDSFTEATAVEVESGMGDSVDYSSEYVYKYDEEYDEDIESYHSEVQTDESGEDYDHDYHNNEQSGGDPNLEEGLLDGIIPPFEKVEEISSNSVESSLDWMIDGDETPEKLHTGENTDILEDDKMQSEYDNLLGRDEFESPSRPMKQSERHENALTNEVKPEVTSSKPAIFVAESLKTSSGFAPSISAGLVVIVAFWQLF